MRSAETKIEAQTAQVVFRSTLLAASAITTLTSMSAVKDLAAAVQQCFAIYSLPADLHRHDVMLIGEIGSQLQPVLLHLQKAALQCSEEEVAADMQLSAATGGQADACGRSAAQTAAPPSNIQNIEFCHKGVSIECALLSLGFHLIRVTQQLLQHQLNLKLYSWHFH
jgi:hypothetical protein